MYGVCIHTLSRTVSDRKLLLSSICLKSAAGKLMTHNEKRAVYCSRTNFGTKFLKTEEGRRGSEREERERESEEVA